MATSDNTDEKLTTQDDFSELFIKFVDAMVDFEHFSRETAREKSSVISMKVLRTLLCSKKNSFQEQGL